jgi:folate-binding protein YgfZ
MQQPGIIHVPGANAATFLQGQVTCDVREVSAEQSRLGAHCDAKGRIQATFRLLQYSAEYYLQLPCEMVPLALPVLQKYAAFSRINLQAASERWAQLGLIGAQAERQLLTIFAQVPQEADAVIQQEEIIIVRMLDKPDKQQPRFLALGAVAAIEWLKQKLPPQIIVDDDERWKCLNIQAGIATIYPQTMGLFTPHQLNYQQINGVSFTKGCYTGQEIIARMHYLGKLKQQMHRCQFSGAQIPAPGASLHNAAGQEVGQIADAAFAADGGAEVLAVLQSSALEQPIYSGNSVLTVLDSP